MSDQVSKPTEVNRTDLFNENSRTRALNLDLRPKRCRPRTGIRGYQGLAGLVRQVFEEWAELELARGNPDWATTLLAGADQLLRGSKRLPHIQAAFDDREARASALLTPEDFHQAWQRGSAFSFDELVDFATES